MAWSLILTTAATKREANRIARRLISDRLAGCVNIIPHIESIYRWKGRVEHSPEWLLLIKTRSGMFKQVASLIKQTSSYDCPEVISLDIQKGTQGYLDWLAGCVPGRKKGLKRGRRKKA